MAYTETACPTQPGLYWFQMEGSEGPWVMLDVELQDGMLTTSWLLEDVPIASTKGH